METHAVNIIMHRPEMKNQTFTPTFSAIGLLKSKPIGIVTEEIKVSTENALGSGRASISPLCNNSQRPANDARDVRLEAFGSGQAGDEVPPDRKSVV